MPADFDSAGPATAGELSVLNNEVQHISKTVDEIKRALEAFPRMDRLLAEEAIRNEQSRRDITLLWERSDQGKLQRDALAQEIASTNVNLASVVNRGKGALWAAGILLGFFQAIVLSAMGWVFVNVSATSTSVKLMEQQIIQIKEGRKP